MKILIITNKMPYPPKDGGAIATFTLASALTEHSNNIDIIAINTSKHFFDIKQIPVEILKKLTFYDFFIDTKIYPIKLLKNLLFSKIPYNAERFISKGFENKIIEILDTNKYDVIQMEGLYVLPYISTIRKHSSAIISYRSHNVEHQIWDRTVKQQKNIAKRFYLSLLSHRIKNFEQAHLNTYDLLVSITNADAKNLCELANNKPYITIPVGIDSKSLTFNNQSYPESTIFFIGALDWAPNIQGLLWFIDNCWDKLLNEHPTLQFHIAGRNASKSIVKHFNKKNILYSGEVADAYDFMRKNAIMIVPLMSGSGMRVKIIEAMSLKKAIVATSIAAEGIEAVHGNEIIIANTPDQFVESISNLISMPQKINILGNNAIDFVSKNFDNFVLSKKLNDFYIQYLKSD